MSRWMRGLTRLYSPLGERGALVDGFAKRASFAPDPPLPPARRRVRPVARQRNSYWRAIQQT
jgi:hypothetical protein